MDLHPISRIATPEEVAVTVCFLAGPHAGCITGESIDVAGGLAI
jgi:NAD(P)-dependent dehydrogenase (short-subunit alcohol dehydrogenase family)